MKNKRAGIDKALVVLSIIAIVLVCFYGVCKSPKDNSIATSTASAESTQEDWYYLDERTIVDFRDAIIEKFNDESKLVVKSVTANVKVDLKKSGLLDLKIFSKSQTLTYHGTGEYYIDLSVLGEQNIKLDNTNSTVVISIPHAQLEPIEIDPDLFEATETTSGILAFGEMEFTAQEYNGIEKEAKSKLLDKFDQQQYYDMADAAAVEEITKLFEKVVQDIDSSYGVEIDFIN